MEREQTRYVPSCVVDPRRRTTGTFVSDILDRVATRIGMRASLEKAPRVTKLIVS